MYSWVLLVSTWIVALTHQSSSSLFTVLTQTRIWGEPSMHCEDFLCHDISGIYLLLRPSYYSSWVSDDWQGQCVDGSDLISPTLLASQHQFYPLEVFGCGLPPCITMVFSIGLWDTQVLVFLYLHYLAFWQSHPFSDFPHSSLFAYSLTSSM